jgi:hypothetical protein
MRSSWLCGLRTSSHELINRDDRQWCRIIGPLFPVRDGIQYAVANAFKDG